MKISEFRGLFRVAYYVKCTMGSDKVYKASGQTMKSTVEPVGKFKLYRMSNSKPLKGFKI